MTVAQQSPSALVSVEWLSERLAMPELVILDASIARRVDVQGGTHFEPGYTLFQSSHIPGAQFADLFAAFSDPDAEFPFTRPTPTALERAARAVGIGENSMVVIYDSLGGAWSARLWWVLRANGLDRVHVLNGGLRAWITAGFEARSGEPAAAKPGNFIVVPRQGFFLDKDDIKSRLDGGLDGTALVCAVRSSQFIGEGSDDPRAGHIPGSISLPYNALLDKDGLIDTALTVALYEMAGLGNIQQPVLYCGGGVNAAGLALAFTAIGHPDVTIYDGSLNEWKADPSLPLVRGEV